jgi:hypothetical protein
MCWWPSWRRDLAPVSGVSSDAYMARHPHPQPQQTDRSAAHAAPGHPGEPRPRQAVIPWAHCCGPAHHQLIRSRLLFARRHRRRGRDSRIGSSNSTRQAGGSCGLWVTTCQGLVFFKENLPGISRCAELGCRPALPFRTHKSHGLTGCECKCMHRARPPFRSGCVFFFPPLFLPISRFRVPIQPANPPPIPIIICSRRVQSSRALLGAGAEPSHGRTSGTFVLPISPPFFLPCRRA